MPRQYFYRKKIMNYENAKYKTSIVFEIKTYEIDIAGHVNNIVYVKWLEDLRTKLFDQMFSVNMLLEDDLYPVVISTNIIYKKQLKYGKTPTGQIWVEYIRHNMMMLKVNITYGINIYTIAEQKCVIMDLKQGIIDKEKLKSFVIKL